MFDLSLEKIAVLMVVALFVLGPERLPAAAGWIGVNPVTPQAALTEKSPVIANAAALTASGARDITVFDTDAT